MNFPTQLDTSRKIIHIDMDAFFASVEERDNPELIGKPVVISRSPIETGGRGVVSTCNYIARQYGIHSAMNAKEAYELCPQAIFIPGNYDKYRQISQEVRQIFLRYTDLMEAASIDEAYLDVTENKIGATSAIQIAKLIQRDIYEELRLTCSAGISYNKFLAKMASDWQKPKGLTVILPEDAKEFLANLPVEQFHGVGKATATKLNDVKIKTGKDLQKSDPVDLANLLGIQGWRLWQKANGIHHAKVITHRERKSISKERTFAKILYTAEDVEAEIRRISGLVEEAVKENNFKGKVVTLKVRYADFTTLSKRKVVDEFYENGQLAEVAIEIFRALNYDEQTGIRLIGVGEE